jgi:hypothetical protein
VVSDYEQILHTYLSFQHEFKGLQTFSAFIFLSHYPVELLDVKYFTFEDGGSLEQFFLPYVQKFKLSSISDNGVSFVPQEHHVVVNEH